MRATKHNIRSFYHSSTYGLTHSASEWSGFTCTSSLTMNPHEAAEKLESSSSDLKAVLSKRLGNLQKPQRQQRQQRR